MKMKKLLSIGVLGLVLACSTSIGASAVTIPTNADIIKIIVNQYKNGTNPVGLLSGVDKDTKIGTILTSIVTGEIDSQLSSHPSVDTLLTKVESNQDNSIATVLGKVTVDEATFSEFQAKFIEIAEKVKAMDTKVGIERILAEQKVIDIVTAFDDTLDVTFGKNSEGKTTASIEKNGDVLVQLNSDNLQTIINRVENLTWTDYLAANGEAIGDKIPTPTSIIQSKPKEKYVQPSQAVINARYKSDTKITQSVVQNADGTTTIKPKVRFTPGTYTESITTVKKTYSVTKDIYVTFNGKDAYISGNSTDGYTIDAGVTGEVKIVTSISIFDSATGKLCYVAATPETVEIPAKQTRKNK